MRRAIAVIIIVLGPLESPALAVTAEPPVFRVSFPLCESAVVNKVYKNYVSNEATVYVVFGLHA